MKQESPQHNQGGYIAVVTMLILMMLLGTGLAYLKWSADESVEFKRQYAALQAYYLAQSTISQDVIPTLVSLPNSKIPIISRNGTAEAIKHELPAGMKGKWEWIGDYDEYNSKDTTIAKAFIGTSVFYGCEVRGIVEYSRFNRFEEDEIVVIDTTIYVQFNQAETWAMYMYLSNHESTHFAGDRISFMSGDILYSWVHSNDQISVESSPIFYSIVTSCADDFYRDSGYNPQFLPPSPGPVFGADSIKFYTHLRELRENGVYAHDGFGFAVLFSGSQGCTLYEWPLWSGQRYNPNNPNNARVMTITGANGEGIFVEGDLYVTGCEPLSGTDVGVAGSISVGASGNIWIMDNLRYVNSSPVNGQIFDMSPNNQNMLGLLSESNVLIMNTDANGKDNRARGADIIIDAGIVALGDCFSFEDQNDPRNGTTLQALLQANPNLPEWYISQPPGNPPNGPDERGTIYLWGQVSQNCRGYVHRSNWSGTGYLKDYHYDDRFKQFPPPFYPRLDESIEGSGRKIVSWGAGPIPKELHTGNEEQ
jgi:type II secretory pathway pseudopilin PulG